MSGGTGTGGRSGLCDHTTKVSVGKVGMTMVRKCTSTRTAVDGRTGSAQLGLPPPRVIELEYFYGLGKRGCRNTKVSKRKWVLVRNF